MIKMCPYAEYKTIDGYNREMIVCMKDKGKICAFTRFCNQRNKMIPNDRENYTMKDCKLRYEVEIPKGASKVRKTVSDNKFLYVDIEESNGVFTYKIKNTIGEIPDYVFVRKYSGGYKIVNKKK